MFIAVSSSVQYIHHCSSALIQTARPPKYLFLILVTPSENLSIFSCARLFSIVPPSPNYTSQQVLDLCEDKHVEPPTCKVGQGAVTADKTLQTDNL